MATKIIHGSADSPKQEGPLGSGFWKHGKALGILDQVQHGRARAVRVDRCMSDAMQHDEPWVPDDATATTAVARHQS